MKAEGRGKRAEGREQKSEARGQASDVRQRAFIALGANLGDSRRTVLEAMEQLQQFSSEPLLRSSLWRTSPVDCPPGSPPFINAVVGLVPRADETPESLLVKLQAVEKKFGRQPKTILNEA